LALPELPHFGFLLRRHRQDAGLTQEELAERAQLSTRAVSDLERGVSTNPRPYTVSQLVQVLELSPEDRHVFERAACAGSQDDGLYARSSLLGAQTLDELVSRESEMHQISIALESVGEGSGTVLLFGGEPGAGKTRLLQEVEIEADRKGFTVVAGRCYATETKTAYYPILEALSGLRQPAAASAGSDYLKRIERILQLAHLADPGSPAQRQLFDDVADVLERAARSAPLVLLIDDLHWADPDSLKLLTYLARVIPRSSTAIAAAFCDQEVSERNPELADELRVLSREHLAERIVVRRLSLEETTTLTGDLMGHTEVSEEFAGFVYRRTKGLPLLIDQLIRALGGRLELRGEIGAGSMGRVFRAYDRQTENMVAAKLVLARAGIELDDLLRFQRESAVLATLDHPNIVRIYDTFTEEHATCIVMELLEGQSLAEVLRDGPLELESAKDIASRLASALSYAHSQSIIHRDIKPDNVMVLSGGRTKVTDFGIAQILPRDTMMGTIATTGMRIGTPLYMAPEQIKGQKLDGRTDIYALGATLFHLVTGRPPFQGDDALAIAVQQVNDRAPAPSSVNSAVPPDWDSVILKAMSKDPGQRFQSVKAMGDRIGSLTTAPAQASPREARRPLAVGAGIVLVAAMLAAVLIFGGAGGQAAGTPLTSYLAHAAAAGRLSGTVLVAKRGKILLDRGYGFANQATRLKNGPRTRYGLGDATTTSLVVADTLQETETGNSTAAETGPVHLGRTGICSVLPVLWKCPASWKSVRIQSLIEGTSGLPDYRWGQPSSGIEQSLTACAKKPVAAGRIRYSSCANMVMAVSDLEQGLLIGCPPG
jgi:transcriptional regulator with XRE-family HTH domain